MEKAFLNVTESYPLYDTILICSDFYGKETNIVGWFTNFRDFANNDKHTFFKSRTIGSTHLAYCNFDSADNVDFVYVAMSMGVRFFGPIVPDGYKGGVSDDYALTLLNENNPTWWLFDLPKHCGVDFRVQQDVIVENTCLATPPGYGPRIGGGTQPITDPNVNIQYQAYKIVTGGIGEASIDNRFPFPYPVKIPRNATIEANIYPSLYARRVMEDLAGPLDWVGSGASGAETPGSTDTFAVPVRYGIQVSLYGYREVQQRGQYHAPGAIMTRG
ncbi:MAG: hypothetical protein P8Z33_13375 [Gammaproteobacteria bacterium]